MPADTFPDLSTVAPDLTVPELTDSVPGAGLRSRRVLPGFEDTAIRHVVTLPTEWQPEGRYPLLVEYPGNGDYRNAYGDVSTGLPEDLVLGYGLTGGQGWIVLSLPYVDPVAGQPAIHWWGDPETTLDYARHAIGEASEAWGGDLDRVVLAGFSRGAIGCGYLGLRDDATAAVWCGFFAYSHFDGVIETWPYPGADRAAAKVRLGRLAGRPVFICQERGVEATRAYLAETGIEAPYTFQPIGFRNHNDRWTLRDIPDRRAAREWLAALL
jgi:hypothetical protein